MLLNRRGLSGACRPPSDSLTRVRRAYCLVFSDLPACYHPASELLLICWGLFFIATRPERETLKARNFAKSVAKGKEVIRRRSLSVDSSASASREEARPQWDSASQGSSNPAAWPPVGGTATAGGVAFSGAHATTARGTAFAAGFPAAMPPGNGDSVATRRASNASSTVSGGNGNEYHHGNVSGCGLMQRHLRCDFIVTASGQKLLVSLFRWRKLLWLLVHSRISSSF